MKRLRQDGVIKGNVALLDGAKSGRPTREDGSFGTRSEVEACMVQVEQAEQAV
jgi:hypothetical protein